MEVKIQIPDNCELIKDGDTYIVKEKKNDKPRTWEEFCEKYPRTQDEYFICDNSEIDQVYNTAHPRDVIADKNICISKEEAEAFLALMQLRQLRKAWIGDWEHEEEDYVGYIIYNLRKKELVAGAGEFSCYLSLSFPTEEMAKDFLSCFKDLCETAKILL